MGLALKGKGCLRAPWAIGRHREAVRIAVGQVTSMAEMLVFQCFPRFLSLVRCLSAFQGQ